ncbi:MAG: hypothetical protein AB7U05_17330 [Mangrovibacterium sp.]
METKRTCSTADTTLMACHKIAQSFSENIFELAHIRTDWTQEYAKELKSRIKALQANYIPAESSQEAEKHRRAHSLMITSLKEISLLRALIRIEFKDDPKFVKKAFEELGYNDLFSEAKNGDYNSLYRLMERFSTNLTPDIREKLISKTIPIAMIDRIVTYYQEMKANEGCFELIHDNKQLDEEAKKKISAIYSEIKDICRIATAYYMLDAVKRDQFCFFRVLHGLNLELPETVYNK